MGNVSWCGWAVITLSCVLAACDPCQCPPESIARKPGVRYREVPSAAGRSYTKAGLNGVGPRLLRTVAPCLPAKAAADRVFGVVVVEAEVGPKGSVTAVRVVRSIPALDDAALASVREWQYCPMIDAKSRCPVAAKSFVLVHFAPELDRCE